MRRILFHTNIAQASSNTLTATSRHLQARQHLLDMPGLRTA